MSKTSIEANKALVQRYFEMWSSGDVTIADEVLSDAWVDHAHPEVIGPANVKEAVKKIRDRLPNFSIALEKILGEGDLVAVRALIQGEGVSRVMWFVRIEDGKMKEMWTGLEK